MLYYFIIFFLTLFNFIKVFFNQKEANITVSAQLGYGCSWEWVFFSVHDT